MKLYLDTSVYGGYYDEGFEDSVTLFDWIRRTNTEVVVSDVVEAELVRAREEVQKVLDFLPNVHFGDITIEMKKHAEKYIEEGGFSKKCVEDTRHIAFATFEKIDYIISWNFKHMVDRQNDYNDVNLRSGYQSITIYSPTTFLTEIA